MLKKKEENLCKVAYKQKVCFSHSQPLFRAVLEIHNNLHVEKAVWEMDCI